MPDQHQLKGKRVGPAGEELYTCDNCSSLWKVDDCSDAQDVYNRITDGYPMSTRECPDCGALCFPEKGDPIELQIEFSEAHLLELEKHKHHDLTIVYVNGQPKIACESCGDKVTRTVDKDELSSTEDEDE